jgi:hypothetical protein
VSNKQKARNTNGHIKPKADTGTVHIRIPKKTINLIRRQAKGSERTMHAHAGFLLRKAAEFYEREPDFTLALK